LHELLGACFAAGFVLDTSRAGGYCIQVGAGGTDSAGLLLPME